MTAAVPGGVVATIFTVDNTTILRLWDVNPFIAQLERKLVTFKRIVNSRFSYLT